MCFQPRTERFEWTLLVLAAGASPTGRNDALAKELASGRRTEPPAAAIPMPGTPSGLAVPLDDNTAVGRLAAFTVQGTTGGYLGTGDFLQFIRDAEAGVAARGLFEGRGPLAILLIILVGGLALNLTPCVLPMIPINLAIIGAGTEAGSRRRGFLLGSTYGAAMAAVYGVLGLIVVLTAGTLGTINSSPWFNLAIAALFVVLALAMFDIIEIDFSKYSSGLQNPTRRGTFGLAFFMGAVAALLAGACVAPVVIQVVLFSSSLYAGGTPLALALPFVLGVGMAIPWPIAGAGLAALPRPGAWMVRVKQAFGVLILATAAYYGYLSYTLFDNLRVDANAVTGSVQEMLSKGWTNSLAAGLERAERENKPVLIDFWATWCKNCLTMDKTTLEDPEVTAALTDYVKIKFQAEDPDAEPARSVMARFNAVGLPTYVILKPNVRAQGDRGDQGASPTQ
jgi:thiol:disulfide interchange protein